MKIIGKFLTGVMLVGLAGSALAGDEAKRVMAIEVAGDDTAGGSFFFNSDDLGFDIDELQVGETRSVIDESGKSVLITRKEHGFSFNIDGDVIEMPDFSGDDHDAVHWISDDGDADVNVHVMRNVEAMPMGSGSGTVILSSDPIDEATQQAIESLLESAGHSGDVQFIDHHGEHEERVMIKKVEKIVEAPTT